MSKFDSFVKRADEIARAAFAEYTKAENSLKKAEAASREYPQRSGMADYEYVAKSARAQADLMEAREALHKAQMSLNDRIRDITAVRQELAEALDAEYAADPSALDGRTLELLKSGILTDSEYVRLMNNAAGNTTMQRIIGKYAADAAEKLAEKYGQSDQRVMNLRGVAYYSGANAAGEKLDLFDVLVEAFRRSASNPAMIPSWDDLTGDIIETF